MHAPAPDDWIALAATLVLGGFMKGILLAFALCVIGAAASAQTSYGSLPLNSGVSLLMTGVYSETFSITTMVDAPLSVEVAGAYRSISTGGRGSHPSFGYDIVSNVSVTDANNNAVCNAVGPFNVISGGLYASYSAWMCQGTVPAGTYTLTVSGNSYQTLYPTGTAAIQNYLYVNVQGL
jgi:hypothetical protein